MSKAIASERTRSRESDSVIEAIDSDVAFVAFALFSISIDVEVISNFSRGSSEI